jgi:nitroreductase
MPPFNLKETDKLLTTTRAVRRRLDFKKPVPREVILECLDISQQAPTGSNRQGWRWIIVTSSEKREALADIYRRSAGEYLVKSQDEAAANGDNQTERVYSSAQYLAENLEKVPVHVIPLIKVDHMAKNPPVTAWAGLMGSIMPAVWSFQLALRARGLGSTLTTLHLHNANEAQDLLCIPREFMQVGLLPVAYTIGNDFKLAKRPPIENIVSWDQWQD